MAVAIPCFNDQANLDALLADLDAVPRSDALLDITIVDNASAEPVELTGSAGARAARVVRLDQNLGGSGGFNAAIALALDARPRPDLVWLIDSDARVEPDTLAALIAALNDDASTVAVGPTLVDPETGEPHEHGGRVDRRTGSLGNAGAAPIAPETTEPIDYIAACCMLVRTDAIDRAGLMPELFLNGDDAAWGVRLARATGGVLRIVPSARAAHPRFDRFKGIARYYSARNGFVVIDDLRLGRRVRFRRAMLEVARAVGQTMIGRDDMAALHLLGLRDARTERVRTPGELPPIQPPQPIERLADTLGTIGIAGRTARFDPALPAELGAEVETRLASARLRVLPSSRNMLARVLLPSSTDIAFVSAKGRPSAWGLGKTVVGLHEGGFVARRVGTLERLLRAGVVLCRGSIAAGRLAAMGAAQPPSPTPRAIATRHDTAHAIARPTVSVVVLSYNRCEALDTTLTHLAADEALADAEIIVVDNASHDGSADMVREKHPRTRLIELDKNVAIEGFNIGVNAASADAVLILDDDAWTAPGAVDRALDVLARDPSLGAVTLLPVHPKTEKPEWPFAAAGPSNTWPVMGCGNLVLRDVWLAAGGYERGYFLYRNDADLALTIAAMNLGVHFDPALIVWHDSPATTRKSRRWFETATRNWLWLCRRHGRGGTRLLMMLLGVAWAGRAAGLRMGDRLALLRGIGAGLFRPVPPLPKTARADGSALRRLLMLRVRGRSK